jgi:hypothetical protein
MRGIGAQKGPPPAKGSGWFPCHTAAWSGMLVLETAAKIRHAYFVQKMSIRVPGIEGFAEGRSQGSAIGRDRIPPRTRRATAVAAGRRQDPLGQRLGSTRRRHPGTVDADPYL